MHRKLLLLACLLPYSKTHAEEGHASATWVTEKAEIAAGSAIRTVIRVSVDKGWHTYWKNPGEVGIPISLEAELPDGWKTEGIQYPAPHRITSSAMTSFCYEGEILLPLTLTAPQGFSGKMPQLQGKLSWLACNDEGCVPGEANLKLQVDGQPESIAAAYSNLPRTIPGSKLLASVDGDSIKLSLTLPGNPPLDLTRCEVFPVTKNIIDPSAKIGFAKRSGAENIWDATARKSEYLSGDIGKIEILLVAADKKSWMAETE